MTAPSSANPAVIAPGDDIAHLARTRRLVSMLAGALGSGLLLSSAYAPLELDVVAWFALVPILLAPVSRRIWVRLLVGYAFGFSHALTNLFWLNTIGFAAGVLLAIYCAFFPTVWYLFACTVANSPRTPGRDTAHRSIPGPASSICSTQDTRIQMITKPLLLAAAWVALEWLQGWLFSGFPWNQLAITQWRHGRLLMITRITGVYGLSCVVFMVNSAAAFILKEWIDRLREKRRRKIPWPAVPTMGLLLAVILYGWTVTPVPEADRSIRIVGIQGNIPQCRVPTEEQFNEALETYRDLTLAAAGTPGLDLVVWPESALPTPLLWHGDSWKMLNQVLATLDAQLLAGSLNLDPFVNDEGEEDYRMLNSALLFSEHGRLLQTYDKIHRVPFGEYVPFGKYLPGLVDLIGMGRDLTPGSEYTLFKLANGVRTGVNICFEDAFPDISREFTKRGADLLMTITNDAWYAESAGSRQHMVHAVFRAVENARPLFRSGNNSDTCLILPDGRVLGLLTDPVTGKRFVRGYRAYDVPIAADAPVTVYTRYGDVFAHLCSVITLVYLGVVILRRHRRKATLHAAVSPPMAEHQPDG